MNEKSKIAVFVIFLLGFGLGFSMTFLLPKEQVQTNCQFADVVVDSVEDVSTQKNYEVSSDLILPTEFQKSITGSVVSFDGSIMNVSVTDSNNNVERFVNVSIDKEVKFYSVKQKDPEKFQVEVNEFTTTIYPTIKDDENKLQEVYPKPFIEEEVNSNFVKVGDAVSIVSKEQVKPDSILVSAESVTIMVAPEIIIEE